MALMDKHQEVEKIISEKEKVENAGKERESPLMLQLDSLQKELNKTKEQQVRLQCCQHG